MQYYGDNLTKRAVVLWMQFFMMVHNENCVLWEKGKTSAVIKAATDFSQRMSRFGPISFSYGTLCQAQLDIGKKYENWSPGKF